MNMIYESKGGERWLVVQMEPKDVLRMASALCESLKKDGTTDNVFYNYTDDQQFRIEVR